MMRIFTSVCGSGEAVFPIKGKVSDSELQNVLLLRKKNAPRTEARLKGERVVLPTTRARRERKLPRIVRNSATQTSVEYDWSDASVQRYQPVQEQAISKKLYVGANIQEPPTNRAYRRVSVVPGYQPLITTYPGMRADEGMLSTAAPAQRYLPTRRRVTYPLTQESKVGYPAMPPGSHVVKMNSVPSVAPVPIVISRHRRLRDVKCPGPLIVRERQSSIVQSSDVRTGSEELTLPPIKVKSVAPKASGDEITQKAAAIVKSTIRRSVAEVEEDLTGRFLEPLPVRRSVQKYSADQAQLRSLSPIPPANFMFASHVASFGPEIHKAKFENIEIVWESVVETCLHSMEFDKDATVVQLVSQHPAISPIYLSQQKPSSLEQQLPLQQEVTLEQQSPPELLTMPPLKGRVCHVAAFRPPLQKAKALQAEEPTYNQLMKRPVIEEETRSALHYDGANPLPIIMAPVEELPLKPLKTQKSGSTSHSPEPVNPVSARSTQNEIGVEQAESSVGIPTLQDQTSPAQAAIQQNVDMRLDMEMAKNMASDAVELGEATRVAYKLSGGQLLRPREVDAVRESEAEFGEHSTAVTKSVEKSSHTCDPWLSVTPASTAMLTLDKVEHIATLVSASDRVRETAEEQHNSLTTQLIPIGKAVDTAEGEIIPVMCGILTVSLDQAKHFLYSTSSQQAREEPIEEPVPVLIKATAVGPVLQRKSLTQGDTNSPTLSESSPAQAAVQKDPSYSVKFRNVKPFMQESLELGQASPTKLIENNSVEQENTTPQTDQNS